MGGGVWLQKSQEEQEYQESHPSSSQGEVKDSPFNRWGRGSEVRSLHSTDSV